MYAFFYVLVMGMASGYGNGRDNLAAKKSGGISYP